MHTHLKKLLYLCTLKTWKDLIDCNHKKKMLKQCFFPFYFNLKLSAN